VLVGGAAGLGGAGCSTRLVGLGRLIAYHLGDTFDVIFQDLRHVGAIASGPEIDGFTRRSVVVVLGFVRLGELAIEAGGENRRSR
jgi:hypothetical protein